MSCNKFPVVANTDSTTATNQVIAANVRRLRAERGMTLEQVVEALEERGVFVGVTGVHRMEHGQRDVRLKEAQQLAAVFGVPLDGLLAPPSDGVPAEVEQLTAELLDKHAEATRLEAERAQVSTRLAELEAATVTLEEQAGKVLAKLHSTLEKNPQVAATVAEQLAGRLPTWVQRMAVPWHLIGIDPPMDETDTPVAKAAPAKSVKSGNKGRKK